MTDPQILEQIDRSIQCPPGDMLLEVGGGYGVLTEKLARKGAPLTVVEYDHKLFAMLERKFAKDPAVFLVKADIMKWDLKEMKVSPPGRITVAGNIPYYITTPLITRLLTQYNSMVRRVYLMVQKEVAQRLVAEPGTKAYGALTLCAQYYSRPRMILEVPARAFRPKPKVDSAFIELEMKSSFPLEGDSERCFFALVRAIFQSRRKMLSNSLKSLGKPADQVQRVLETVKIDPQIRGEKLGLDKLIELSLALK